MPTVNLYQGNCLDELKKLPDNSIDAVVTDPPYGLGKEPDPVEVMKAWVEEKQHEVKGAGFMSKSWDAFVPQPAIWKEVYRVLKPGGHIVAFFGTRTYDWGVMAMRFAGFEIRDRIQWVFDNSEQRETFLASLTKEQRQELGGLLKGGDNEVFWVYGCYSDDTECFTSNGWKRYNQIDVTRDEILQWHQETNQFSWFKPDEVLVFEAPQEMVFFQNRHTSQLLTKNHNVYLKHRTNSRYAFKSDVVKAENVKKSWHKIFPLAARLENGQPNSFAYIIGWWLTDAWLHKDGKACMFSQSKPKTLNKLRSALESFDCKFSEYIKKGKQANHQDEHTFYVTGSLSDYLITNFKNRELDWSVMQWDYESRFNLLEGLLDGNGTRNEGDHVEVFWSKKITRLDIVSALCSSLGIRNHIDPIKGCVYLNRKTSTTEFQRKHTVEVVNYEGEKVWCLKTETGAFLVRRDNRPFISGNSGFPKSLNIGKAVDKLQGNERETYLKPIAYPDSDCWGKPNSNSKGNDIGFETQGTGTRKDMDGKGNQIKTKGYSDWEGWHTALKPANEPIVLARKKLEGTVAENVLKHGTGAINVDGCRIGKDTIKTQAKKGMHGCGSTEKMREQGFRPYTVDNRDCKESYHEGRFPANLIFDEAAAKVLDEQTKNTRAGKPSGTGKIGEAKGVANSMFGNDGAITARYDDEKVSGAARFFYCAKASKKDRNEGCGHLQDKLYAPSNQAKAELARGNLEFNDWQGKEHDKRNNNNHVGKSKNNHPTVKPMSLMAYLCRLITPPNGTVLDPFMGSGSTGKAAVIEGFNFVGVELDPEYFKIAEARINYALSGKVQSVEDVEDESPEELPEDEKEPTDKPDSLPTQLDMFD